MGNWMIRIDGIGPHHNGERGAREGFDANHLAAQLVGELQRKGHSVQLAVFHVVGKGDQDLLSAPPLAPDQVADIAEIESAIAAGKQPEGFTRTEPGEAFATTLGGPLPPETPAVPMAEDAPHASAK